MVEIKAELFLVSLLLFSGFTSGLNFQVQVSPTPELNMYQPEASNSKFFNASVSIVNPGSVGCKVRIRGRVDQEEREFTRYSSAYRMWPGETTKAEFYYLPVNYTGKVKINLSAVYCEKEAYIGNYSFEMNQRIIPNKTIKSKTLEVNSSSALVRFDLEKGLLIPQKYPAYWKMGSEKINSSKALIEYEPTLFKKGETITYTVVQNKTIVGKTEIALLDQEKWYEEIIRKLGLMF